MDEIRLWPAACLSQKCQPVSPEEWPLAISAAQMCTQVMFYKYTNDLVGEINGVGVAANQVGIPLRVFVMSPNHRKEEIQIVINPGIISHGREIVTQRELCLSHPGMERNVSRFAIIEAVWWDEDGKVHRETIKNRWVSRIFQHEYDHLAGISCMYKPGLKCLVGDDAHHCKTCAGARGKFIGKSFKWEGADEAARESRKGWFARGLDGINQAGIFGYGHRSPGSNGPDRPGDGAGEVEAGSGSDRKADG